MFEQERKLYLLQIQSNLRFKLYIITIAFLLHVGFTGRAWFDSFFIDILVFFEFACTDYLLVWKIWEKIYVCYLRLFCVHYRGFDCILYISLRKEKDRI
jgi:hypothetical protein